jgi:hypothetical protein
VALPRCRRAAVPTVARIISPWLSERLGQQVTIENRPGVSTNIAVQAVVNSPRSDTRCCFTKQRARDIPRIISRLMLPMLLPRV